MVQWSLPNPVAAGVQVRQSETEVFWPTGPDADTRPAGHVHATCAADGHRLQALPVSLKMLSFVAGIQVLNKTIIIPYRKGIKEPWVKPEKSLQPFLFWAPSSS